MWGCPQPPSVFATNTDVNERCLPNSLDVDNIKSFSACYFFKMTSINQENIAFSFVSSNFSFEVVPRLFTADQPFRKLTAGLREYRVIPFLSINELTWRMTSRSCFRPGCRGGGVPVESRMSMERATALAWTVVALPDA
ncbi:hypothetical protein E2C01_047840 [Portunus trituberculatus]|uniref:Uncharacterized protein n=1 Tax=Portunus trituberculatus TaxID=210409 RepID=A0A5B7G8T7_PORTR|nr:hypothetical protein [Portunus trituberculatus]